jgi:hypothetical protein
MGNECPIKFARSHLRYLDEEYLKRNRVGKYTTLTTSKDLSVRRNKLRTALLLIDTYESNKVKEISRVYFNGLRPISLEE